MGHCPPALDGADEEALSRLLCTRFLNAKQLREVCKHRGFVPPKGQKKDALADFVAARLLEPVGVAEASATLEAPWPRVLHWIAARREEPTLRDLRPVVEGEDRRTWSHDYRRIFKRLADGLLSRGVVLVREATGFRPAYESRFESVTFRVPAVHRELLPPYPVETVALGARAGSRSPLELCRRALAAACGGRGPGDDASLLARVGVRLEVEAEGITFGGRPVTRLSELLGGFQEEWRKGVPSGKQKKRPPGLQAALDAASHVLSHLPEGEGVTVEALRGAIDELGLKVARGGLAAFLEEGYEAGLLVRGGAPGSRCFRSAKVPSPVEGGGALAFEKTRSGLRIDLQATDLQALLALTRVSRLEAGGGTLEMAPDPVRMGRRAEELDELAELQEACAGSPAFAEARDRVRTRAGKLFLHANLAVLRVEDAGLRALLCRDLGDRVRELGGEYLALPVGSLPQAEKLAAREGYAPRRVS